ncbi:MAG: hypothetical protein LBL74_08345 [Bacteroidales bacterium]|jgi:hypothetical protein|nr:hypothetical protein [Bacteroidales bacterium]
MKKIIMLLIAIIGMGISVNAQIQQEGTESAISEKPQKKIVNTTSRKGFEIGVPFGSIFGYTYSFDDEFPYFSDFERISKYLYLTIDAFVNYRFSSNFALGVRASTQMFLYFQAEYNFNTRKPKLSPFVGIFFFGNLIRGDIFGPGAKVGVRYSFNRHWAIEGSIKIHYVPNYSFIISIPVGFIYHF